MMRERVYGARHGEQAMITHAARIFLLGIILLIGLADAVRAQSTDALYERAKAEGSVTLYGAGPPEPFKRWIKDFQQQYPGVTVVFTGGLSNALDQKIERQIADHKMAADVGIFQTMQDFVRWKQQGALMLFKPDGFDKIDPAFKDEDGAFTTVSVNSSPTPTIRRQSARPTCRNRLWISSSRCSRDSSSPAIRATTMPASWRSTPSSRNTAGTT